MSDPYRTAAPTPVEPKPKKPWRYRFLFWAHVTGAICFATSTATCATCQGPRNSTQMESPLTWALTLLTVIALGYTIFLVIMHTEQKP